MSVRPSILCPIDFSDASAGALRYAAAVATHFGTRLIVLTVEDPLLTEALDLGTGIMWTPEAFQERAGAIRRQDIWARRQPASAWNMRWRSASLRRRSCAWRASSPADLIVVSTHGLTGMRKLFFGSTTERVLRETTTPVLITPGT